MILDRERPDSESRIQVLETNDWHRSPSNVTPVDAIYRPLAAWSPDGEYLAVAQTGQLLMWERESHNVVVEALDPALQLHAMRGTNSGKFELLVTTVEGSLATLIGSKLSEMRRKAERRIWAGWSPDGSTVVFITVADEPESPSIWRASGRAMFLADADEVGSPSLPGHQLPPGLIENIGWGGAWSPDSQQFALAVEPIDDDACSLIVCDRQNSLRIKEIDAGPLSLFGARWSPRGDTVSALTGRALVTFDASTLSVLSADDVFYKPMSDPFERPEVDGEVSMLGFSRSHAWSWRASLIVVGAVGGLKIWEPHAASALVPA
jgi:hypothetical protein